MAVSIWKLATTVEYRTLSALFGLGRSTVGQIVVETCEAITNHLIPRFVKIPDGTQLKDIVDGFENLWGFPQAAGAIDGSHIPIIRPEQCASDYYNRKGNVMYIFMNTTYVYVRIGDTGYYSMIMQALVDHMGRFMDVYIGWPGKVHDARVFVNSELYRRGVQRSLFPDWKRRLSGVEVEQYLLVSKNFNN